ncbi:MAG TPA: alpha/beta hydrolase [Polyangiaceae bacterium]|jgi:alpha-beta hydrolase superfamily lysophospholipase
MTVQHDEGAVTRRAVPGPALYFTASTPSTAPRACVGLVHGYADHAARYAHVMDFWASHGIASVAIDLRGHGRATGPRGFVSHFDEYLDDVAELARLLTDRTKGAPTFLMGHSMGGLVAALSAIEAPRNWRGLLLSAPYFGLAMDVPAPKKIAGRIASRIAPKFGLPTGLKGADLTHDPVRAREHDEDPLVFPNATARWYAESVKAQARVMARASALSLPLFEVFGTGDRIAKFETGRAFFQAAGSKDKTFDERPGLFHEVLNEPSWEDIAGAMEKWMLARV